MTAQIIQFKKKYIILSAVCNTCEISWTAEVPISTFQKFTNNGQKCICPFCGYAEVGLAKQIGK